MILRAAVRARDLVLSGLRVLKHPPTGGGSCSVLRPAGERKTALVCRLACGIDREIHCRRCSGLQNKCVGGGGSRGSRAGESGPWPRPWPRRCRSRRRAAPPRTRRKPHALPVSGRKVVLWSPSRSSAVRLFSSTIPLKAKSGTAIRTSWGIRPKARCARAPGSLGSKALRARPRKANGVASGGAGVKESG